MGGQGVSQRSFASSRLSVKQIASVIGDSSFLIPGPGLIKPSEVLNDSSLLLRGQKDSFDWATVFFLSVSPMIVNPIAGRDLILLVKLCGSLF